jgi:hypothetical protein
MNPIQKLLQQFLTVQIWQYTGQIGVLVRKFIPLGGTATSRKSDKDGINRTIGFVIVAIILAAISAWTGLIEFNAEEIWANFNQ